MQVILRTDVDGLGKRGDIVDVADGHARNFLLPKGKATLATAENIAEFEARRAELEARQADELAAAEARAAQLAGLSIRIEAKAGVEGKLFGSLGTIDIAEACTQAGVEIQRSEVRLPEGPLRMIGEHEVDIVLHTDVATTVTVLVEGEEGALASGDGVEVRPSDAARSRRRHADGGVVLLAAVDVIREPVVGDDAVELRRRLVL